MTSHESDRDLDAEMTKVARSLHHEWESPELWPAIARRMRPTWRRWPVLAAATVVIAAGAATWLTLYPSGAGQNPLAGLMPETRPTAAAAPVEQGRLLSDEAFAEIERSEAQYVRALEDLSRVVAPKLDMPDSPLLVNLRDRLKAIDAAIDESRLQIHQNPFNAQLRRQLLYILQEKRRTLEQVQEHDDNPL